MNVAILAAAFILSGCGSDPFAFLRPQVTGSPIPEGTVQPIPTESPIPELTATQPAGPLTFQIWVPPQFDPSNGTDAGKLFKNRLDQYLKDNLGVQVEVRVKAVAGPGGLMESLTAASSAAPSALPSLVALSRQDLETAALKGLVFPIDSLSQLADDPDWYPYARQLSLVQGSNFGLPFAGDAMLLAYRPAKAATPPPTWDALITLAQPILFPAADPQAYLTLLLYQSANGTILDAQKRPALLADPLLRTLKLFAQGAAGSSFPAWITQYQTDGQSWQAFRDGRADWVVTWASRYFSELLADSTAVSLPTLGDKPFTLASGWVWAVSDPDPQHRSESIKLAEYLVQSDFLSAWTAAVGYLPTRPSALATWKNLDVQQLASRLVLSAQVRPSNDVMASLGPVLEDATMQVLTRKTDPAQAAQAAVERLAAPPPR